MGADPDRPVGGDGCAREIGDLELGDRLGRRPERGRGPKRGCQRGKHYLTNRRELLPCRCPSCACASFSRAYDLWPGRARTLAMACNCYVTVG